MKTLQTLISLTLFTAAIAAPQTPAPVAPRLEFEVVSVKLHPLPPNQGVFRMLTETPAPRVTGNRLIEKTASLLDLIMEAYGVKEYQITGMPEWAAARIGGMRYDIEATVAEGASPTVEQLRLMMQTLLADRFQLRVHHETKPNVPVFALLVDKGGSKITPFHKDENAPPPAAGTRPFAGTTLYSLMNNMMTLGHLDLPLVDRTGLADGAWDFDINQVIDWTEYRRLQSEDRVAAGAFFVSTIRSKLGLTVDSRKESMEVLVIDHAEQPSAN